MRVYFLTFQRSQQTKRSCTLSVRANGLCDCGTTEDDAASLGQEAAGWPFFGQFVAHDITADRSALQSHADPSRLRNARSPQPS